MDGSVEKLVRDLRVVLQDSEELIKATSGDIEEKTRAARARLAGALVVARESLNRVEDSAARTVRVADRFVHNNPYPLLGSAFLVGLLLGVLAVRRDS